MSFTTIYYYGLLFSFSINLFVFYLNIYHNDNVNRNQYTHMLILHYVLLLLSWVGVITFIIGFLYNITQEFKKPRKKR